MPTFRNPSPLRLGVPKRPRPPIDRAQMETLEEHEAAQNAIEFATLKRQADETMFAALREAENAPDEEGASKILEAAKAGVFGLKSKNVRVQNAFSAHVEGSLAGWGERFARQAQASKEKRIYDKGMQEYDAALDADDPLGAMKATQYLRVIAPEDSAIFDEMDANVESESALRQVRGALADGNYASARELAEKARGVLRSVKQREELAKLEGVIGRATKEQTAQAQTELLVRADKAASLPPPERYAEIERIKATYAQTGASPEEIRATFNWLDAIAKGEAFAVDPQAEIEANDIIQGLDADSTPQENTEARDKILALEPRLGPRTYDFIKELGTRLETAKTYAVNAAVDDLVARGVIDKSYADVLRREVEKYINAQTGPFDPGKVYAFAAGLAATLPEEARPEAKHPPVELSNILGQLKAHQTQWSAFGPMEDITERVDAIRLIEQKIWYDTRLTDENRARLQAMLNEEYPGPEPLLPPDSTPAKRTAAEAIAKGGASAGAYVGLKVLGAPLPVVKDDAERDALSSGTIYVGPDGQKRRKR